MFRFKDPCPSSLFAAWHVNVESKPTQSHRSSRDVDYKTLEQLSNHPIHQEVPHHGFELCHLTLLWDALVLTSAQLYNSEDDMRKVGYRQPMAARRSGSGLRLRLDLHQHHLPHRHLAVAVSGATNEASLVRTCITCARAWTSWCSSLSERATYCCLKSLLLSTPLLL